MEFRIKQSVLKEELGHIQGVVERKTTIPVLSNILIESIGEKEIRMIGTDLDCTIRCDAEAEIISAGSICVQARKLFDIVRALDAGDVHFAKKDNEWVNMKAGRTKYCLAGVSRDQFPDIPQFKSTPMRLPADVFSFFIRNTAFAMTTEQSRFTLSGAKFIVGDGVAKMVTTDGHRLAYVSREIGDSEGSLETLVPRKALQELVKLSRGADEVAFGEDDNHIYFETEGRLLITRKLTGQFPNYEMVMPKDNDQIATFDLTEMRSAVYRMSLIADERSRSIRLTFREGEIEVTAQSNELGEGSETVKAGYVGDEITLAFNSQYLSEFLQNVGSAEMIAAEVIAEDAVEGEAAGTSGEAAAVVKARANDPSVEIAFEFKNANAQTQMSIAGETNYDYKYIVMPLRI